LVAIGSQRPQLEAINAQQRCGFVRHTSHVCLCGRHIGELRKTAEPIDYQDAVWGQTHVGPRNHIDEGPDPPAEGTLFEGEQLVVKICIVTTRNKIG